MRRRDLSLLLCNLCTAVLLGIGRWRTRVNGKGLQGVKVPSAEVPLRDQPLPVAQLLLQEQSRQALPALGVGEGDQHCLMREHQNIRGEATALHCKCEATHVKYAGYFW